MITLTSSACLPSDSPASAGSGIRVDVRVIGATNRNLQEEVKLGRFRLKKIFAVGDRLASYLKKETPLVVLCDLKMPKLSGFDVLQQIKAKRWRACVVYG